MCAIFKIQLGRCFLNVTSVSKQLNHSVTVGSLMNSSSALEERNGSFIAAVLKH